MLCLYHLFVWSNLNFLHIAQWITLPTQSYLFLYSFCVNLRHSLIMWLMVSSLSPHSLHLLFCCVLSILALIWLVLTALSCAAIRRDSISPLKFPILSYVLVFSCEMPPVLLLVFRPVLTMLKFELSRFVHRFPTLLALSPSLWGPFQEQQLQLVSLSLLYSTEFLVLR